MRRYHCHECGCDFDEPYHESWTEYVDGIGYMPMGQDRCPECGGDDFEEGLDDGED